MIPSINTHPANELPFFWKQGEHVCVIGDTGTGKTFLISRLVRLRNNVVIFRTKPDDIRFPGFYRAKKADVLEDYRHEKILLEPKYEDQGIVGFDLLNKVWLHGSWTIVVDEHWYTEKLGLKRPLERLLTQGRSKNITVVVGMQRPVDVSRFTIAESTHVFSFRLDGRDAKTLGMATTQSLEEPVQKLNGYDFIYFNRKRRILAKGEAKQIGKILTSYRDFASQTA